MSDPKPPEGEPPPSAPPPKDGIASGDPPLVKKPFRQETTTPDAAPGSGPGVARIGFIALGVFLAVLLLLLLTMGSAPNPRVLIETSMGPIEVDLYQDKAPTTVENFLRYVDEKHYDGTIFHRVMKDFMIQGGGFTPDLKQKNSKFKPIMNEAGNGLTNDRGTLAMARTNDPDSATDQFYINVVDNKSLNRKPGSAGYAVFGKVIKGMDVVDRIREVPTQPVGEQHEAVPVEPVIIRSIRRVEVKDEPKQKQGEP